MRQVHLTEAQCVYVSAHVALLNCRVAGMRAFNDFRMSNGLSIAYDEEAFIQIADEFEAAIGGVDKLGLVENET